MNGTYPSNPLDANQYQNEVIRTLLDTPDKLLTSEETMIIWNAIGLGGESGEVLEIIKKGIFHRHGIDKNKIIKELGDVIWYVTALCDKLNISLGDVLSANVKKLRERYPNGYKSENSINRIEND